MISLANCSKAGLRTATTPLDTLLFRRGRLTLALRLIVRLVVRLVIRLYRLRLHASFQANICDFMGRMNRAQSASSGLKMPRPPLFSTCV